MKTVDSAAAFHELKQRHDMVLIYFGSSSCGVCRAILPELERRLTNYAGVAAVQADMQGLPELSAGCGVFTVPAVLLFVQGKETVRQAGFISLDQLEEKLLRYCELLGLDAAGPAGQDTAGETGRGK